MKKNQCNLLYVDMIMTLTEKGKVNSNIFKWKNTEIKLQTKFFFNWEG